MFQALYEWTLWGKSLLDHARNERGTRERLIRRQRARLRSLMHHVYRHSPYYRRIMRERRLDPETCEVSDLPMLTRDDAIEHFDEISTDPTLKRREVEEFTLHEPSHFQLFRNKYTVVHSSGTSGRLLCRVLTIPEWIRSVSLACRYFGPLRPRSRVAFLGVINMRGMGVSMARMAARGLNRLFCNLGLIDVSLSTESIVRKLNEFQPRVIMGYAGSVHRLVEPHMAGRLKIRPQRIIISGESISADALGEIARAFPVPIMNVYACTEHGIVGAGDASSGTFSLFEDELIIEPHPDGAIITNLFARTVPLIRYQMSDHLDIAPSQFDGPFRIAHNLSGRSEHFAEFLDSRGNLRKITAIYLSMAATRAISQFQLVARGPKAFDLRYQPHPSLDSITRQQVIAQLQQNVDDMLKWHDLSQTVSYRLVQTSELLPDPRTGKFRLIVSASDSLPASGAA